MFGDAGYSITSDSSGNVYVTGQTGSDLDGQTGVGVGDFFVMKYDSEGAKQWTRLHGSDYSDTATGITSDSSGNVYVTGYTEGSIDNHTNAGQNDLFVVKYDSSGAKQWTKQLGTASNDIASGIATDSSGNVYVTGNTDGALDNNTSAGLDDLFVVKYDSGGAKQWIKQLGTSSEDRTHGIATDSSGNVYVTGSTRGALDGSNVGGHDLFVVKYDSGGAKQWTKQLGTSSWDFAYGIATDSSGNVYVTGSTWGDLDGSNAGYADLFVVKYDSGGIKQWTQQLGSAVDDTAFGITTDSSGSVYVTGSTWGVLNGINVGGGDLFVVKFK